MSVMSLLHDLMFPNILLYPHPFRIIEYRELMKLGGPRPGERVLDLGCGSGIQAYCMAASGAQVIGLETDPRGVSRGNAEKHRVEGRLSIDFVCSRLQDAGFADESFDAIFSFSVIEHIPEYAEILRLCRRLLKQGGRLVFSTDWLALIRDQLLIEKHKADHHVVHYFTRDELAAELSSAGFRDVVVKPLFRGDYAAELFARGIRGKFSYRYREAWSEARKIARLEQGMSDDAPGLFLVASAVK